MSGVCPQCARRAWLFTKLSARIDFRALDLSRLWPVLELSDIDLIDALGGRRREELHKAYVEWEPAPDTHRTSGGDRDTEVQSICRHHALYPRALRKHALAPHALTVRGGAERLDRILKEQVVAIVGTRRASDYGMETARGLARGLAASGLTVASGLTEGIPAAVHSGALEANGSSLTVMSGGVDRCSPAWSRGLHLRITSSGCAISEPATRGRGHRWWEAGRARTLALLARLVIVVEAAERPWELACAHVARAHGRLVAAVPGRVNSPASRGTNSLLMSGARFVRCPQDALDLLYEGIVREQAHALTESIELDPRLRAVLERVGDGADTVAKLAAQGSKSNDAALALTELEMRGLLLRGDAGRYVPRAGTLAM
jgi:DNA processing protein